MVRGQIRGHPDELDRQPVTGGRVACYSEEARIQEQTARNRVARARSVMACGGDLAALAWGTGRGGAGPPPRRLGGRVVAPGFTVGQLPHTWQTRHTKKT